jgi:hypothetical protein
MGGRRSAGERLRAWWRAANAVPVPSVAAPGRAAVPYPRLERRAQRVFAKGEEYLLREVIESAAAQQRVAAQSDLSFDVPWIVQPQRARSAMSDDTKGHGVTAAQMQEVVDWLVQERALRPLPDAHRDELVQSGIAARLRRTAQGWPPTSGSPGYAEAVERSYRACDRDTWVVVPAVMLAVYPHLADATAAWRRAAGRPDRPRTSA